MGFWGKVVQGIRWLNDAELREAKDAHDIVETILDAPGKIRDHIEQDLADEEAFKRAQAAQFQHRVN